MNLQWTGLAKFSSVFLRLALGISSLSAVAAGLAFGALSVGAVAGLTITLGR